MKSILIADSNTSARKALKLILKHRFDVGQVCESGDVESLIRALADCLPDLLLLDWSLYGAPAPETCQLLRKAYPTLKIILLSADANDIFAAQKANALFIHKGSDPEQFIAMLSPLFSELTR